MNRTTARRSVSERATPVVMLGRRLRLVAVVIATAVFAAVAVGGVGVTAAADPGDDGAPPLDHRAWVEKYGVPFREVPNLPDVGAATPEQRAAATDLLIRTEAATAAYDDPAAAEAAGYTFIGDLARAGQDPGIAGAMGALAAAMPDMMNMMHVKNNHPSGAVLDPSSPDQLMYTYQGDGTWKLTGVMYMADGAYPGPPPVPGGPITRWHYHPRMGSRHLMMHLFFVPDNDLAHAYAMGTDSM